MDESKESVASLNITEGRYAAYSAVTGYRVLEAGDDVGDAEHDAARVAGEARAGAELLLGQVSQEPEVLACNALQCSY